MEGKPSGPFSSSSFASSSSSSSSSSSPASASGVSASASSAVVSPPLPPPTFQITASPNETSITSTSQQLMIVGKAPIASMDAMEDMEFLSESNPQLNGSKVGNDMAVNTKVANTNSTAVAGAIATVSLPSVSPTIKYRHVGKTGLKISNLGLGGIKLFSNENPEVAEDIVAEAVAKGINFFDVSEPYNPVRSEHQFGRIFRKLGLERRNITVCTKIYWDSKAEDKSLSRKEIIESVKASLKNLEMDYIDLVLVNKADPNCPCEEVCRAMHYLVNAGLVMYWGTSRWSTIELFELHNCAKEFKLIVPICENTEYHWLHREKVEVYMAELYNKIGFGTLTWSPISFGLTGGTPGDDGTQLLTKMMQRSCKFGNKMDTFGGDTSDVQGKVKQLVAIADRLECSPNQLMLAWCIRNQTSQCTVLSASSVDQFKDLMASVNIVPKITHYIMEDIDKILANKPSRPPMISTLQQRWQTTGGVPAC